MNNQQIKDITEANLLRSELLKDFPKLVSRLLQSNGILQAPQKLSTKIYTVTLRAYDPDLKDAVADLADAIRKDIGKFIHMIDGRSRWVEPGVMEMAFHRAVKPRLTSV